VLVAGSSAASAELALHHVKDWGYNGVTAFDLPTALDLADAFHPKAIILDLGLLDTDGRDAMNRLRQSPGRP